MKKMIVLGLMLFTTPLMAVDRSRNAGNALPFTGDNMEYFKHTLSSFTATAVGAYSSSRGALTCVNADTTNAVYIGSSTAVVPATNGSFPIYPKQSVQITNTAGVYAVAEAGVASVVIYCVKEY